MDPLFEITIDAFAYGGEAIGTLSGGKRCFVHGAMPGERVAVSILTEKKSFLRGKLEEILTPSPHRETPLCPLAISPENTGLNCPGCSYQHVPYPMEIEWKQAQLKGFLVRNHLTAEDRILPPFAAPQRFHWRNRIKLSHENGALGYKASDNTTVLPVKSCPLAKKLLDQAIVSASNSELPEGVTSLYFRQTHKDGVLRWNNLDLPREKMLTEQLSEFGLFSVPQNGFFQTNIAVAAELARMVTHYVQSCAPDYLLELYCGVGIFSIVAAEALPGLKTEGVELDSASIKAAKMNAGKRPGTTNCRFYAGDAAQFLREKASNLPSNSMILADPPRSGLSGKSIQTLLQAKPRFILYISCATDTLQRDLAILCKELYSIKEVRLLDMFPCTAHFESITLLEAK